MKPIDLITGLPRSPDVARLVETQGRHGEVQTAGQAISFSKQMTERSKTVTQATSVTGHKIEPDSGGGGNTPDYQWGERRGKKEDPDNKTAQAHPTKGKMLDLRGAD
jgi:hypothetical protein